MGLFKRIADAKKAKQASKAAQAQSAADAEKAKQQAAIRLAEEQTKQAQAAAEVEAKQASLGAKSTQTIIIWVVVAIVVLGAIGGLVWYLKKGKK